jgi:hypothetical protein
MDWRIALSPGGPPKADEPYRAALQETVEQEPRANGQRFSTWTCADLAQYLAEKGRVLLSAETVRRHLLDLGYRIVRPVLSIASPDPDYDVKAEALEQLKAQARRGELTLLFEDEVDLNLLPGVIGCWTKRGQQRKVPTPGQNVKRYGFGAVNFMSGQVTHHIAERKNSDGFIQLVEQIVQTHCPVRPGRVLRSAWLSTTTSSTTRRRPPPCWQSMPTAYPWCLCPPTRPSST